MVIVLKNVSVLMFVLSSHALSKKGYIEVININTVKYSTLKYFTFCVAVLIKWYFKTIKYAMVHFIIYILLNDTFSISVNSFIALNRKEKV